MFNGAYRNRRVLVTGHTGFKGSWLVLWLRKLGADVTGLALPPETEPNHWNLLGIDIESLNGDLRDEAKLADTMRRTDPHVIFHLAAQPLVRRSSRQPLETWNTTDTGTANLLNACRGLSQLQAVVPITSDRCYLYHEDARSYKETDPLGGHDPYSASKAATELVVDSFRSSFFNAPDGALLATGRAGNVVGGGDWSEDRLIPDAVRAVTRGETLEIRSPRATRPWQHVLECLSGYLMLGQHLIARQAEFAEAWNFGPDGEGNRTVEDVLTALKKEWPQVNWSLSRDIHPHEAHLLQLDCSKAHRRLQWQPVWTFEEAIAKTAQWYRSFIETGSVPSEAQLDDYANLAAKRNLTWTLAA